MRKIFKYSFVAMLLITAVAGAILFSMYGIFPSNVVRPSGIAAYSGDPEKLLALGKIRHGDTSLSPIGRSCNTCHSEEDSYNATFNAPYPHYVRSVRLKTGLGEITAEGMVQFCMISAMEGKPLPWESDTLAALTAFVLDRHKRALGKKPG
jgi:hypothetical protein